MTEAEPRIAHLRDWVPLTPAFLRVMSFVNGRVDRAQARINRDLREERLHAALVALDGTIKMLLGGTDWEQRTVCAPLNPAEGVRVEPYEEGDWFIRRAGLNEWYPTNPAKQPKLAAKPGSAHKLVAAVENRLEKHQPGKGGNEQWERFCDEVRKSCGKKATDRGYSDKTIKRIVAASTNRTNRQDKQDI